MILKVSVEFVLTITSTCDVFESIYDEILRNGYCMSGVEAQRSDLWIKKNCL